MVAPLGVIFGKHTYSDGGQTTAEVAAWNSDGNWMLFMMKIDYRLINGLFLKME
jgi:hypothetical protein